MIIKSTKYTGLNMTFFIKIKTFFNTDNSFSIPLLFSPLLFKKLCETFDFLLLGMYSAK